MFQVLIEKTIESVKVLAHYFIALFIVIVEGVYTNFFDLKLSARCVFQFL